MTSTPTIDVFGPYLNVINNELRGTASFRNGINPATEENNPNVPLSGTEDVDAAVLAGKNAFQHWCQTSQHERKQRLMGFCAALEALSEDFAKLLTKEQGKPVMSQVPYNPVIPFSKIEITSAVSWMRGLAEIEMKDTILEEDDEKLVIVRYVPLGVVAGIVPWNFPIHLACGKIALSVLSGNVIILKPSPFTPYCGIKLVELAGKIFPPGVVQVLSGDDNLGPLLTTHPGIAKISFTGSTETGKKVMASASGSLKRLTLELGGMDPAVVCPSADIEVIVPKIATVAFLNSGQLCLAIKRIYVHESIYAEFKNAFVQFVQTLKVGSGADEAAFIGPVQNKMQFEKVKEFLTESKSKGFQTFSKDEVEEREKGYFINPTVVDRPPEGAKIGTEEPFGPIVPLFSWETEEEVVTRANDSPYGLGASVWGRDLVQANRIARQLQAGSVWVNAHFEPNPLAALGGHKESGMGSEAGLSGLQALSYPQTLYLRKPKVHKL
ncbi:hypothetical protein E8E13_000370 [Curvularia kusanoi]|uniref:aldehyde dehydrogenase (NAD(+)) n=1 Tax=Curvularia kusanoi TaxID=90978 RepID=A0A9P4T4N1_CURKU|nr:hypothetical protein E8E13_000370 [Curvularia kusanoi]